MPILDAIPFQLDQADLFKRIHVREGSANATEVAAMVAEAQAVARPKALYQIAYVDERGDDYVVVDGRKFTSRVLRVNLDATHRVFAYVATSGHELEDWAVAQDDLMRRFWADVINQMGVYAAAAALGRHLIERFGVESLSTMNPGSLADWPLAQQRVLFALLGDTEDTIGVRLTESLLMVPTKSVSGLQFPAAESFASCQLCPREVCPNRRAAYDAALYDQKYRLPAAV